MSWDSDGSADIEKHLRNEDEERRKALEDIRKSMEMEARGEIPQLKIPSFASRVQEALNLVERFSFLVLKNKKMTHAKRLWATAEMLTHSNGVNMFGSKDVQDAVFAEISAMIEDEIVGQF